MRAIEEPKAMVHRSTTFATVPSRRSLAVPAVGISTFMMAAFAVGMPLIAIVVTVMLCITCVGIARVWSGDAVPPVIESPEARRLIGRITMAHVDLAQGLAHLGGSGAQVLDQCTRTVRTAERLAHACTPLQRYLDSHDVEFAHRERARLSRLLENTEDPVTSSTLSRAILVCTQHQETRERLLALEARMLARLELVRCVFEAFGATLVRLRVLGDDVSGDAMEEELAEAREELDQLVTMEEEIAAAINDHSIAPC